MPPLAPPGRPPSTRRRRRVRWQAPLVLLSLLVGGTGQAAAAGTVTVHRAALQLRYRAVSVESDRVATALSARRSKEVTAVLDRMSAALAKRDLAGYLAAFDGDADLHRRQTAVFQALGRIPFAQIRYGWDDSRWSRPLGLTRKYGDNAIMAVVHRHYHLK